MGSLQHPFGPLFNEKSRVLILGSFPSVKSREQNFFYGHPQNRFWKVIAAVFDRPVPDSIEEKKQLILDNGLALWDSIASCEITGSSDASIRNARANDIGIILDNCNIEHIYCNGRKSHELYSKYIEPQTGREAICLPSTSPANAQWTLEKLIGSWSVIKGIIMTIKQFFEANNKIAVAFSGGVDSAYLLYAAVDAGADVKAYYVKSAFQPEFEFEDAKKMSDRIGCELQVIEADVLSDERVVSNPVNRCYYCKQHIMRAITEAAKADGYDFVCDGTNASDDADDRPGFRALGEFGIRSPLRECGLSKADIRNASKEAGLPTWNKPAYACLATRIRTGEMITKEKLGIAEKAESIIYDLGFRDFRVRMRGKNALVQIVEDQHAEALAREDEIKNVLSELYDEISIDGTPRVSG